MAKDSKTTRKAKYGAAAYKGGASGIWFLGLIGSLVYHWESVESFWTFLVAVFKSIFWPAYLIYALSRFLGL